MIGKENGSPADTVMDLIKESSSPNQMSVERIGIGSCSVTDGSPAPSICGNLQLGIGVREEQIFPIVGSTDGRGKCQARTSPDLDTMVESPFLFQQPCTGSQQIQLHAQILVYGSIIQGSVPEEALMIAAFGDFKESHDGYESSDGGSSVWHKAWHFAAERCQGKALFNATEVLPLTTCPSTLLVSASDIVEVDLNARIQSTRINVIDSINSPTLGVRLVDLKKTKNHSPLTTVETSNIGSFANNTILTGICSPYPDGTLGLSPLGMSVTRRGIPSPLPGSAAVPSQKVCAGGLLTDLLATVSSHQSVHCVSHHQKICGEAEQRGICSVETISHLELAKLNAEEAASVAATAVGHSHAIWDRLCCEKNSGLISDHEAKLASSAAVAAAALAGAAAAAAKVAYEATVQAKHFAEEALSSNSTTDVNRFGEIESCESNLRKATPIIASILKGKEKDASSNLQINQNCHSSYPACRDSSKQNGRGASAIMKTAQDLGVIVRASELVEEVVSQAGAVVAMGDPSPWIMETLLDAGSKGYLKVNQGFHTYEKSDIIQNGVPLPEKSTVIPVKPVEPLNVKEQIEGCKNEIPRKIGGTEDPSKESSSRKGGEVHASDGLHSDIISIKKHAEDEKKFVLEDVQTNAFVAEAEALLREKNAVPESEHGIEMVNDSKLPGTTQIKEGSLVEVVSDEGGVRKAWLSAKVLSLKNGKALINYDRLLSHKGPGQLQEWVSLDQESGKAPRIRLAHPMTIFKFEGAQKRQRAAMDNHVWSFGDHVDAWIRDGWWEGIVMGKNEDDEDTVAIHFPGEDDTATIKSLNLRPSLAWMDGQWLLWTELKPTVKGVCEDYLPVKKRQKLDKGGSTEVQHLNAMTSSVNGYKSFLVGKSSVQTGSSATSKGKKGTCEKESSGVAFGVSSLENKRKLMGVSKHPVNKISKNASGANIRSKYNQFKALGQSREKHIKAVEYKKAKPTIPRPKDSKPEKKEQQRQNKSNTGKDKSSVVKPKAAKETSCDVLLLSGIPSSNKSSSKEGRSSGLGGHPPDDQQPVDVSSFFVFKEVARSRPLHSTKLSTSSATESEQGSKGKLSSTVDCSQDAEASIVWKVARKGKHPGETTANTMGPHKSTRRIQPPSQLLQGGQRPPRIVKERKNFNRVF